jgi:hypothetical protein
VGSLPLVCVGIMGEYMARIYDEVRQRPLSIINHVYRPEAAFGTATLEPKVAQRINERDLERLFPAA